MQRKHDKIVQKTSKNKFHQLLQLQKYGTTQIMNEFPIFKERSEFSSNNILVVNPTFYFYTFNYTSKASCQQQATSYRLLKLCMFHHEAKKNSTSRNYPQWFHMSECLRSGHGVEQQVSLPGSLVGRSNQWFLWSALIPDLTGSALVRIISDWLSLLRHRLSRHSTSWRRKEHVGCQHVGVSGFSRFNYCSCRNVTTTGGPTR